MKNIFITGGSGFIGRNLQEYLSGRYSVFVPLHKELDLLDTDAVRSYIIKNNIKVIIHCANVGGGRDNIGLKDAAQISLRMFSNIVGNKDLVERIIHFGSGAEYDKARPLIGVKEEEFGKKIPDDDYGFYKYTCSKYILNASNITCLRLFGVYGKYENYLFKFISNSLVKNLLKLPIIIGQNVLFDYIYIDDLVKIAEYFIMHKHKYKDYNAVSGKAVDLITIAKIINRISDFQSEIIIKNQGLNLEYTADNKRLTKEIPKLKYTDINEGIKKLREWYKIHLKELDINRVKEDPYIKYIKVNN